MDSYIRVAQKEDILPMLLPNGMRIHTIRTYMTDLRDYNFNVQKAESFLIELCESEMRRYNITHGYMTYAIELDETARYLRIIANF